MSSTCILSISFLLHFFAAVLFAAAATTSASGGYCTLTPPPAANANIFHGATNGSSADDVLASAWYPGWLSTEYPLEEVSWEKYSALTWAFAATTPDSSVIALEPGDDVSLPQFVAMARANSVKALLSIGGWTSSRYFSTSVSTPENRTAFVGAVNDLVRKYQLDGVDFDWEYPNRAGLTCNTISSSDSANFLLFLQELRASSAPTSTGEKLIVSAAVGIAPFVGEDGTPMTDVSDFADVLDYIEIMAYDIWGSWSSTAGPNAPLNDTCAPTTAQQQGSAVSAIRAWSTAKFPLSQIALGVAAYGHSFHVTPTAFNTSTATVDGMQDYPNFDKALQPAGDKWDGAAGVDPCGEPVLAGGIFDFWGLVDGGYLDSNGTAVSNGEVSYEYDQCSQTPYVYSPTKQVLVVYDDAKSFAAKGEYIASLGLKGFAMWHAAGDFNDILLDAISDAIGIERVCPDQ